MAKNTINISCPNGYRRKAQMMPNSSLLEVRYIYPTEWFIFIIK